MRFRIIGQKDCSFYDLNVFVNRTCTDGYHLYVSCLVVITYYYKSSVVSYRQSLIPKLNLVELKDERYAVTR